MSYAIEMPTVGPMFERFQVDRWILSVGDPIAFGDALCSLVVNPEHRPNELTLRQRLRLSRKGLADVPIDRTSITLFAREDGMLASTLVNPGDRIGPGSTLGVVERPDGKSGRFALAHEMSMERTQ